MSEAGGPFRVALTFDAEHPDRPGCPPDATDRILAALVAAGARATFFIQGRWASAYPDRARRIAEDGHLVGHHSHHHARMTLLSDDGIRSDVRDGEARIRETTGRDPRPWFRCPFGTGHDDPRVLAILRELGYRNVHWHVVLKDWEPWRSAVDIESDAVARALARRDRTVILLHAWPDATARALPGMLERLGAAGARFVAVDELEELP